MCILFILRSLRSCNIAILQIKLKQFFNRYFKQPTPNIYFPSTFPALGGGAKMANKPLRVMRLAKRRLTEARFDRRRTANGWRPLQQATDGLALERSFTQ